MSTGTLATKGLAPKLYAVSIQEGVPTAQVMEHLPPHWITLDELEHVHRQTLDTNFQAIDSQLALLLKLLQERGFVHGDLRPNNVMVDLETLQGSGVAKIKVIDFDWSGKANEAQYPGSRNPTIKWPVGSAGGLIGQDHDAVLLSSWWCRFGESSILLR
ncbi:hypothetical protein MD484_g9069, partial [Candolleomyces efflorescens]